MPLTLVAYLAMTASNQPVRRSLPVVTPYSPPVLRSHSPCGPVSSVGKGPAPTRVVYAFTMPITLAILVGPMPFAVAEVLGRYRGRVDAAPVVHLGEHLVLLPEHKLELLAEDAGIEQILCADAHPPGLVGVGRADAAPGGADPGRAEESFGHPVERSVVRHDQVRVGRDQQPVAGDPAGLQSVDLLDQDARVDHHAIADHRRNVR